MASKKRNRKQVVGLVGVGLDCKDEHKRITKTEEMLLVGGSEETHERMQDVAIYFGESLKSEGKRLEEASIEEVAELLQKAFER